MFQKFREIWENRHQYARDWKERGGGKVVGYLCTYAPEEVLYAAGILPVRILGGHEPQTVAETHISGQFCVLCRDCLAQGLLGRYDYLDGITSAHTCLHMRQTYCSWEMHLPVSYAHYIYMPAHVQSPRAKECLVEELKQFHSSLEEWRGRPITPADLDRAIEIYNTNRRLTRQLYEMRRSAPPALSGAEAMEVVLASMVMDKEEHNQLLSQVLEELPQRKDGPRPGARLMILGGENDDVEFVRMVESLGCNIVVDEQCAGSRYFWNELIPEEDRLRAIAARYIDRPPCPAKDLSERRRFSHVMSLARDYGVEGAILTIVKFCEPHGFDNVPLQGLFNENNIPTLSLEFDVTLPVGPFRTRVEAFLETLQLELV